MASADAWDVDAIAKLTTSQLVHQYQRLLGRTASSTNRRHLIRWVAWGLQAAAQGGLSERARRRAGTLVDPTDLRVARTMATNHRKTPESSRCPLPGTVLARPYQGRMIQVDVLERGFRYDGRHYRSLTAVARTVTGSHWSGNHFFGLTRQQRKSP